MTTTQEFLDIVIEDHRPIARDSREAIRLAVIAAAADRHGAVHIVGIRKHLPAWVAVEQTGAVINRLVRRGYLVPCAPWFEPNGGGSRNASKPSPVRRLVKPIPPDALT